MKQKGAYISELAATLFEAALMCKQDKTQKLHLRLKDQLSIFKMKVEFENLKTELEAEFREFSFSVGKRIYGQCLIAKKSKYSGADIFLKDNGIIVEAAIALFILP